jgi:hypothetical protein
MRWPSTRSTLTRWIWAFGMMNDALGLIAQCEDEGVWPGYAPEVQCLNLPSWVYGKGAA